LTLYSEF